MSKTSEINCFSFRNFTVGYSRNFLSLPSEFIKSLNANKFTKLLRYTYFFSLNETQHKGIENLWKIDWQIILKKNCHCFCNSQCPRNRKIVKLICELGPLIHGRVKSRVGFWPIPTHCALSDSCLLMLDNWSFLEGLSVVPLKLLPTFIIKLTASSSEACWTRPFPFPAKRWFSTGETEFGWKND